MQQSLVINVTYCITDNAQRLLKRYFKRFSYNYYIMVQKMSKQDLQWQAENDARTMAQYQEILGDKNRMNRAIKAAEKEAKYLSQRANDMQSAAKIKSSGRKK